MAIKKFTIEDLKITPSFPQGWGIYSFEFQPSLEEGTSVLYVNVVNETGVYDLPLLKTKMSYRDYFKFEILGGDQNNGITIYAYLTEFTESLGSEAKTLRLKFADGSHILDRVFVAVLNKEVQANPYNCFSQLETFKKEVFCENCDFSNEQDRFIVQPLFQQRIINNAAHPFSLPVPRQNFFGGPLDGGFILVGKDKYTETSCQMPSSDFNLSELVIAAKRLGVFINIPDLFPFYRTDNSGTLREVLSRFCSKFGLNFRYNFSRNPAMGHYVYSIEDRIDKHIVYNNINILKYEAKKFESKLASDPIVTNITDEESISETEKCFTSLSVKKDAAYDTRTKKVFYKTNFYPIKLEDIINVSSEETAYRTESQLIISSFLGKGSPVLRQLYNIGLSDSGKKPQYLQSLGFTKHDKFARAINLDVIGYLPDSYAKKQRIQMLKWTAYYENQILPKGELPKNTHINPEVFDVYLGVLDSVEEQKWSTFDSNVERFLGRYYYNFVNPKNSLSWNQGIFFTGKADIAVNPSCEAYETNKKVLCSSKPFPFQELMKGGILPSGSPLRKEERVTILNRNEASYGGDSPNAFDFLKKSALSVQINNCKTSITEEKNFLNPLEEFKLEYMKVQDTSASRLLTDLKRDETSGGAQRFDPALFHPIAVQNPGMSSSQSGETKNPQMVLAFLPSKALIDKIFTVSPFFSEKNDTEKTRSIDLTRKKKEQMEEDMKFCRGQKNPNQEQEIPIITDPVTGQKMINPCFCTSPPLISNQLVYEPSSKPDSIGLVSSLSSSFIITLKKLFGASHNTKISQEKNVGVGELKIILPVGSRSPISSSETYIGSYEEQTTREYLYQGFIKTQNNFIGPLAPPFFVSSAKIKVTHEDISSLIHRNFANRANFFNFLNPFTGLVVDIPMEIENPLASGFLTFQQYYLYLAQIEAWASDVKPRKTLTLSLTATDNLGAFFQFLNPAFGFSSVRLEKSENALYCTLSFETKPPRKFDMFKDIMDAKQISENKFDRI